ncbi:dehydroascorbate reductase 2 [Tanacetum coccineum]
MSSPLVTPTIKRANFSSALLNLQIIRATATFALFHLNLLSLRPYAGLIIICLLNWTLQPPPAGGGISSPPPSSISAAIDIYVKAPSDRADVNTDCPFCQRVLLTLREKKLVYNTTFIYLENKPEWFAETWTLPLIRFDDGTWASNSDIIVEMIEKKRPDIPLVTPQHFAYLGLKILPKLLAYLKNNNNDTRQDLLFELMELEKHLSDNEGPYVNGKDVTAVDLSLAPKLYHLVEACEHFYGWNILKKFPKVLDYNKVHPHAFFNS